MAETMEKLEAARAKLDALHKELVDKRAKLSAEENEAKRNKLVDQIAKIGGKYAKAELDVRKFEIQCKRETIATLEAQVTEDEVAFTVDSLGLKDAKQLAAIIEKARLAMSLRDTRLVIVKQEKEVLEFLRRIVEANPTGWTSHDDVNKRYKYFATDKLMIVLQDSPDYGIAFDVLVNWIGLTEAVKFAKVDKTALVKAIEAEQIKDVGGKLLTMVDWEAQRVRSIGEPKVVVKEDDAVGRTVVLIVRAEFLGLAVDELGSCTGLTGHELNPLKDAGVVKVAQLRGLSGEQLMAIPGIGSVRATRIIDEISQLGGGTSAEEAPAEE